MLPTWMLLFCQVCAVALFLHGFLPVKPSIHGYSSLEDLPVEPLNNSHVAALGRLNPQDLYKPTVKRIVFMVIDALRTDFVLGDDGVQHFPQLHKLIRGNFAQIFKGKTHTPTVTLPRIKALTSGTIPGFVDVILNFDTTKFAEDNFITQAYLNKKRLAFYGDETWLKLFPDHFVRSDGTTSFFVTDFTEVDNNVTRHVKEELNSLDWDVLILHYLGLDHIGHVHGPRSYLIPSKLLEMDWVIHQIHTALEEHDKVTGEASTLLVCGDHGMSDVGGHGGATLSEISVPLIFLHSRPVIEKTLYTSTLSVIPQISVAPTLSVLMGLPIPKNNLGIILPEVLWNLDMRSLLYAVYVNGIQLRNVVQDGYSDYLNDTRFKIAVELHANLILSDALTKSNDVIQVYISAMLQMMTEMEASLVQYDFTYLVVSIFILWLIVLCSMARVLHIDRVSMAAYKCIIGFIIICLLRCAGCLTFNLSSQICQNSSKSFIIALTTLAIIAVLSIELLSAVHTLCSTEKSFMPAGFLSPVSKFGVVCWFMHSLSLLSSSFIEEEHQTWYFLSSTVHVIMVYYIGRQHSYSAVINHQKLSQADKDDASMSPLFSVQNVVHSKVDCSDASSSADHTPKVPILSASDNAPENGTNSLLWMIVASALCSRICRSWNQTGDKWAHLPDVKFWINKSEQNRVLSFGIICSLLVFFLVRKGHHSFVLRFILFVGLVLVYCYHYVTGSLLIPLFPLAQVTRGLDVAQLAFLFSFAMLLEPFIIKFLRPSCCLQRNILHSVITVWLLLNCLLARPHNIILIGLLMLHEQIVRFIFKHSGLDVDSHIVVYTVFGMASFFQQGNSNSLARLDVAAGYVGLSEYWFGAVGMLMWCNTYCGLGFWMFCMMESLEAKVTCSNLRFSQVMKRMTLLLCLTRGLPLAIFFTLVTCQRHHLFIWSVFTPKLLYESMHTIFILVIVMLSYLLSGHNE